MENSIEIKDKLTIAIVELNRDDKVTMPRIARHTGYTLKDIQMFHEEGLINSIMDSLNIERVC